MWSLEPGKCVQINLEKTEERFWTAVCKGDPEIDRTKVDSTRNIDDFDEQTQTDFQQVMYDHQQKLMGKPTSKEKVEKIVWSCVLENYHHLAAAVNPLTE